MQSCYHSCRYKQRGQYTYNIYYLMDDRVYHYVDDRVHYTSADNYLYDRNRRGDYTRRTFWILVQGRNY
jgi:hypothetical protein